MRLLFSVMVWASLFALIGCSPRPAAIGCEKFAELVDDVALSTRQPGRLLDGISGEAIAQTIGYAEFLEQEGLSNEEVSRRYSLWLGGSFVVTELELLAQLYFHDDILLSRPAYKLWVSAAVQESGGNRDGLPALDTRVEANLLSDLCKEHGHAVPTSDTDVIADYLQIVVANK